MTRLFSAGPYYWSPIRHVTLFGSFLHDARFRLALCPVLHGSFCASGFLRFSPVIVVAYSLCFKRPSLVFNNLHSFLTSVLCHLVRSIALLSFLEKEKSNAWLFLPRDSSSQISSDLQCFPTFPRAPRLNCSVIFAVVFFLCDAHFNLALCLVSMYFHLSTSILRCFSAFLLPDFYIVCRFKWMDFFRR